MDHIELPIPRRALWSVLLVSAAVTLAVCYSIASQQLLLGSYAAGWMYPYVATFHVRAVGAAAIVIGCAWILFLVLPTPNKHEWLVASAWILAAIALQGMLRSLAIYSMADVFSSDAANAFYGVTQVTDAESVLRDFARGRLDWPLHAQSNMPGKILLVFGLELLSSSPSVLPWLIVAVSSAGGVLLYLFVRDLFSDQQVALFTLILYLFLPARLFFLPLLNTVTPVVFFACAYLVLRWLRTGNQWYAAAAGVAVYGLVFFEPLPLVMGVLFVAFIGKSLTEGKLSRARVGVDLLAGALAFAAAYLGIRLWMDFDLFDALRSVAEHAVRFNVTERRPYAYWIQGNLREFLFGVGVCQAILFVSAAIYSLRVARSNASYLSSPLALTTFSLAMILLITDLVGVNRGEVIRLWIFLACFFQIPAAYLCARLRYRLAIIIVFASTVLQTAIASSMIGFVVV